MQNSRTKSKDVLKSLSMILGSGIEEYKATAYGFRQDLLRLGFILKETDPIFMASPAAQIEVNDLVFIKALPSVIHDFQTKPGEKGDPGYTPQKGVDYFDGAPGSPGTNGITPIKGIDYVDGKDGKDGVANPGEVIELAGTVLKTHEELYNHRLINPFLVGSKLLDETGMKDGMFLQYHKGRLHYATVQQIAAQMDPWWSHGSSLPAQNGQEGKRLGTDGTNAQWQAANYAPYVEKTSTYVVTSDDGTVNCTSGTFTVTMPSAVGLTGQKFTIKNTGSGTITVAFNGAETADGLATLTLAVQYDFYNLQSTGSNWILV